MDGLRCKRRDEDEAGSSVRNEWRLTGVTMTGRQTSY